jgi:hypothetical protein
MAQDAGVLMVMYLGRERVVREGIEAAHALSQVMHPRYPMELLVNARAMALVEKFQRTYASKGPWARVRQHTIEPWVNELNVTLASSDTMGYLFKLTALLRSSFARTVFIDCDVFVIRPTLIHGLLNGALRVSDIAMPLDPGRTTDLVVRREGAAPPPWVAPAVGPPMLCSALLAFGRSALVNAFFSGAARRLAGAQHPGVRQGDQEMMWFQWVYGNESKSLRVLTLPEETYCPLEHRQVARQDWRASKWRTSWRRGVYPCAAVHGHAYLPHVRREYDTRVLRAD